HRASWPARSELPTESTDGAVFDIAGSVLAEIRKAKTAAKKSLRADVRRAVVSGTLDQLTALDAARGDLIDAGRIVELVTEPGGELAVDVLLAD
ncbi:MAG TPA: hypothetical protein VHI95_18995, partial [Acidimicrobiales bacterium]|nr:hypothetical protein [Acidimicrobiales bacterium]